MVKSVYKLLNSDHDSADKEEDNDRQSQELKL